jgi:ribonuclease P protein component
MESDRDQTHLPAEQSSTRQDAWLPVENAYPGRARHPLSSSPQGPRRTVGLSRPPIACFRPEMLPPEHRMRRSTEFAAVLRSGAYRRRGCLVLSQQPALNDGAATVGLVVGKSVGGSVVRHRVSRRLRAQLGLRLDVLAYGSATVGNSTLSGQSGACQSASAAAHRAGLARDHRVDRPHRRRPTPAGPRPDEPRRRIHPVPCQNVRSPVGPPRHAVPGQPMTAPYGTAQDRSWLPGAGGRRPDRFDAGGLGCGEQSVVVGDEGGELDADGQCAG